MPRIRRIALIFTHASQEAREAAGGIVRYANEHGPWELVHIAPQGNPAVDYDALPGADGFIGQPGFEPTAELFARPQVCGVGMLAGPGACRWLVTVDEQAVANRALDEFAELGIQHIACASYSPTARDRAMAEVASERGIELHLFPSDRMRADDYWPRRHEVYGQWLQGLPKPLGLFAHNANLALDMTAGCLIEQLNVPEQVAVLTYAADEISAEISIPPLSSIEGASEKIGYEAARMLDQLMAGREPRRRLIRLPPVGVVHRGSTDVLAGSDPVLAMAVRFIRRHACDPIKVDDVLAEVPVARRTLEYAIRNLLGRSPHQEIQRVQLERTQYLLRTTEHDLRQIANETGLGTPSNLAKFFKRKTGMTPSEFREVHRVSSTLRPPDA